MVPGDANDLYNSLGVSGEAIEKAESALGSVDEIIDNVERDSERARALPVTVNDLNEGVGISDSQRKNSLIIRLFMKWTLEISP